MIKNSIFGRRLLHNWLTFSKGMCPSGNFPMTKPCGVHSFPNSDQVGLWNALPTTYSELILEDAGRFKIPCDNETGYLSPKYPSFGMTDFQEFFDSVGVVKHSNYLLIPKGEHRSINTIYIEGTGVLGMFLTKSFCTPKHRSTNPLVDI